MGLKKKVRRGKEKGCKNKYDVISGCCCSCSVLSFLLWKSTACKYSRIVKKEKVLIGVIYCKTILLLYSIIVSYKNTLLGKKNGARGVVVCACVLLRFVVRCSSIGTACCWRCAFEKIDWDRELREKEQPLYTNLVDLRWSQFLVGIGRR